MNDPSEALRFLPLHPLAFRILLSLREGTRHGYSIVKEIERRAPAPAGKIFPANLYRRLRDLADNGLIENADAPTGASAARRPRRYFRLTPLGLETARAEMRRMESLLLEAREKDLLTPAERPTP